MECSIVITEAFETWWDSLSVEEQESVGRVIELLEAKGVDFAISLLLRNRAERLRWHAGAADPARGRAVPGTVYLRQYLEEREDD
jgi:hypothetical protein